MRNALLVALLLSACRSSAPAPAETHFEMIPLQYASAPEVADQLSSLVARDAVRTGGRPIAVFQADARTNSLLVSATAEEMKVVRELVAGLDQRVEKPAR